MNILVTGAGGLLGRASVAILARASHKVVSFDIALPKETLPGVTYVSGDITQFREFIATCIAHKVERVLHLAALVHHHTHRNPYGALQINVMGLGNVLEAARILNFQQIVYASSVALYGPQKLYTKPVTEADPYLPATLYGATKAMNEATAAHYKTLFGISSVGLRPHFSFGPGRYDGAAGQFSSLIKACALGEEAIWHRVFTPKTVLAPMHADDMAAAFAYAVSGKPLPEPVYNVGGQEALTEEQMVRVVGKVSGNDKLDSVSAGGEYNLDSPEIDCSRFREQSGFRQNFDFEGAVRASFDSYRK